MTRLVSSVYGLSEWFGESNKKAKFGRKRKKRKNPPPASPLSRKQKPSESELFGIEKFAREMRGSMSPPEARLWACLKPWRRWADFRAQEPLLGSRIADFYLPSHRLAVEVDGSHHMEPAQLLDDEKRAAEFSRAGITTLRFTARRIFTDLPAVLDEITRWIQTHPKYVTPQSYSSQPRPRVQAEMN